MKRHTVAIFEYNLMGISVFRHCFSRAAFTTSCY